MFKQVMIFISKEYLKSSVINMMTLDFSYLFDKFGVEIIYKYIMFYHFQFLTF